MRSPHRLRPPILAFLVAALVGAGPAPARPVAGDDVEADADTDGDGLADFQEIHKYRTDPGRRDTAGKGSADGDPRQRREFAYSVRAVVRVMPPYNLAALNDDYQDVRVLAETKDWAELEIVAYPLNTNAQAIVANPNWKADDAGMRDFLAPGVTTNWDEAMRGRLRAELARDGIDPDGLTDREVVERVSRWFYGRSAFRNMFGTFFVHFPGGQPAVVPGLEEAFRRNKGDAGWTDAEQFARELLGREMFERKSYGTCTSAAVAQATVLRALGIPTRIILAIPLADGSDPAQVAMVETGLTHHQVRADALAGLAAAGDSFASHTFLEVFVGRRWRRLNYGRLGQNVLDPQFFGLMLHVHTFLDLSDAGLAPTWGARYALGRRDETFRHSNPYRTMAIDDHFGASAEVPNPPAREHKRLTIGKLYWADAEDAPDLVRGPRPGVAAGTGRLVAHAEEWLDDAGDYLQYKPFLRRADGRFVLRAEGQPDVRCAYAGAFFTQASRGLREFAIDVPPEEFAKMARGVAYTLHPADATRGEYRWEIRDGLGLRRD